MGGVRGSTPFCCRLTLVGEALLEVVSSSCRAANLLHAQQTYVGYLLLEMPFAGTGLCGPWDAGLDVQHALEVVMLPFSYLPALCIRGWQQDVMQSMAKF